MNIEPGSRTCDAVLVWAGPPLRHAFLVEHHCYELHIYLTLLGHGKLPRYVMRDSETLIRPTSFSFALVAMNGSFIKRSVWIIENSTEYSLNAAFVKITKRFQ